MRILLINKFYRIVGGPETMVRDTERELKALGHEVIPFSMSHPDNWPSEYSSYFVPTVDYNTRQGKGFKRLAREAVELVYSKEAGRRLEKLIAHTKPDIAHLHNIYHQISPSVLPVLKKAGIPSVMTLHDGKLLCSNMIFFTNGKLCEKCAGRWFHHTVINKCVKDSYLSSSLCCLEGILHRLTGVYERNIDIFITPSRFLKDKLIEHGRLSPSQIEVIPNYAYTESIKPCYTPGSYGLYLGRVEEAKGIRTLVKAAKGVDPFKIKIAGRGFFFKECERMVELEELDNVRLLGFQQGTELVELIRGARFIVLPSEWYENCPMVVLEAFAAGKPVIASRIGGNTELVNEGSDGLLFEPGNVQELSDKMRLLVDNHSMAQEMGRNGRLKAEQRYSMKSHLQNLLSLYQKLTEPL